MPGKYFSPGGLEAGMSIGPGAEMLHAEVILIHTNDYSGFPSLIRNTPMPSTATAETKVILGQTNPFPIRDFMRWPPYRFFLHLLPRAQ